MKMLRIAAGLVLSACFVLFAGCAAPGMMQGASPSQPALTAAQPVLTAAQKFHNAVTAACNVLMPTIVPLTPLFATQPGLLAFNTDIGLACAANAVIDLTSVNSLVGSSISAAQGTIAKISSLDSTQRIVIIAALGAFKGSLQNALAAYQASTSASTPLAASAPIAASQ
ncbi:hypothetical protein ACLKMY_00370 [Paraburkholderia mimosarum]|uniref:hypothetical protein n=1 Tax=Paraburkholderia mimosarum TaxID=312026 RepID=UPI0039C0AC85